jgi:translocation and assembly module TamB
MPPLPTLLETGTRKVSGRLALTGHLHSADLGWLAAQSPHIRRVSGQLDATLSVNGPASDPAVSGTLRVTGGELRPELDLPSVQALNLEAEAAPDGVHVQTLSGELGAAPFRVTGSLGRTGRAEMEASLGLQGENLLLYRGEGVKLRADSTLSLAGPLSLLRLSGEVAVTDGYYEKYFDVLSVLRGSRTPSTGGGFQLFSLRTPPLSQAAFDIRFTSRQPFRVRNNLMKGSLRPDLRLEGTGLVPVLTGVVYVDETHLVLPAGTVRFESGLIRFDRTRPDRPILHLVGKSRIGGYDITMLVEGPLDEPTVTLSSVPPVSSEDLLRLVLTGRIPGSRDGDAVSSGAPVSIEDVHPVSSGRGSSSGGPGPDRQKLNVAVYVGRDLVARWFGGQYMDANSSILDRFEIELGRSVTRSGDDTIDAQFRLAQGVLRDGDTLYITGEKDVFDFYNAGIKIVFRFK